MNELEQFVSILNEIAETIDKVNPSLSELTEGIVKSIEKFSSTEQGMKSLIEILNIYTDTILRLSGTEAPVIKIPDDMIVNLRNLSRELSTVGEEIKSIKEESDSAEKALSKLVDAPKKGSAEEALKIASKVGSDVIVTPEELGSQLDSYGDILESKFSGILDRLKEKFNITSIVEEPKKLSGGVYRVIGEQLEKEGEEAKKVAFYVDRLGEVHSNLRFTSKLTSEEIKKLIADYSQLETVLRELELTEKNIIEISDRPDIAPGVKQVKLGDEKRNFTKSVYVDTQGRYGFTKSKLLSGYSEKQFNSMLREFPKLKEIVDEYGLSVKNLEGAFHDVSRGIHSFIFFTKDANGVVEKFNIRLDKQGNIIKNRRDELEQYSKQVLGEISRNFPNIHSELVSRFNKGISATKLNSGVYKITGYREENGEIQKTILYIDKLGKLHANLAFASKVTSSEVEKLITDYKQLRIVLHELELTEKNIINISDRPDIAPGVKKVELGDEERGFRKSVYVDTQGRYGFTRSQLVKGFSSEQFSLLLKELPKLKELVDNYGLSVNNLESAFYNVTDGVRTFVFSTKNASGEVEKFIVKLDKQGNILRSKKEELEQYSKQVLRELSKEFPSTHSDLLLRFNRGMDATKLNGGIYKVTGYREENGEIQKTILYIDRLGKVYSSLNEVSKVTREEIGQMAVDFQHLRRKIFEYGYSLEDVKNIEKTMGGEAVKVIVSNEDLGTLTLYADNLGRVGRTLSEMRNKIPTAAIENLTKEFSNLNRELEKYGASLNDITKIKKIGNITEISFSAIDKDTGIKQERKLYGDAQGRIFSDAARASQLTADETMRVAAAYENAMNAAKKFGGSVENLTTIIQDEKNKITELVFAIEDSSGKVKQLSIFTDEAGRVGYSKKELGGRGFSAEELNRIKEAYSPLIRMAKKYGFEVTDLKRIHTEASTGITRFTFAAKGLNGEMRMLSLSMDKYGNILKDVQRKYQGFLDGIARNIVEASKWAVAIQLTYVPLQKLEELISLAIDNESKLANVAISMNISMKKSGEIFNQIAQMADSTATSLNDAIEGFSAAYRATAGLGNQAERTSVALKLLRTSLILSKVASIDQAESMDILVGALRQANIPLSQSEKLLDKWISVSKNAQVGVNDLAEAYSVVGAAALNSGFSVDKLNGIISAMVESTPYSGKEVGNILRSFISNVQSSEAEKQLNGIGIAVRDVTGEFRNFADILDDIAARYSAGIIDDTKLKEIARSLAGGSRRAAPFITMITTYARSLGLAKVSNEAFGDSEKALRVKLETSRASLTKLSDAFQKLAKTVGSDGGVLDIFSTLTDVLSGIVKLTDSFVESTGKAGVMMLTLLPLMGYLKNSGRLGGVASPLNQLLGRKFGYSGKVYTSQGWVNQPKYKITPNMVALGISGAAIIGSAAYQYVNGGRKEKEEAIGSVVGAGLGAAVAFALGQPELAMAASYLGQLIGSGFTRQVNKDSKSIVGILVEEAKDKSNKGNEKSLEEEQKSLEEKFYSSFLFRAVGFFGRISANTIGKLLGDKETVEMMNKGGSYKWGLLQAASWGRFGEKKKQEALELLRVSKLEAEKLESKENRLQNPTTSYEISARVIYEANKEDFSGIINSAQQKTKNEFQRGKISTAEYENRIERISNLSSNLPFIYKSLGDNLDKIGYKTTSAMEGLSKLSEIYIKGTDDEVTKLSSLFTELEDVDKKIDEMHAKGLTGIPIYLKVEKEDLQRQIVEYSNNVLQNIHVRNFKMPTVIKEKGANEEDVNKIYERAKEKMKKFGDELIKVGAMTEEEYLAFLKNLDDMFVEFNNGMKRASEVQRWAWDAARNELLQEGALSKGLQKSKQGMRIQSVDFSSARAGEFKANIDWARNFIQSKFPDYKLNPQEVGIIYKDNITDVLHEDLLVINMAQKRMIEIGQKQLDGIYNLPEGATFWVPYQAFAMQFNAQGGGASGTASGTEKTGENEEKPVIQTTSDNSVLEQNKEDTEVYGELKPDSWWDSILDEYNKKQQEKYINSLPIEPYSSKSQVDGNFTQSEENKGSIIDKIINGISEAFKYLLFPGSTASSILNGNIIPENNSNVIPKSRINELNKMSKVGQENQAIEFSLELTNRQTIMLDGNVVAQAVSKYLGNQLLIATRGGSFNKSVEVI